MIPFYENLWKRVRSLRVILYLKFMGKFQNGIIKTGLYFNIKKHSGTLIISS